MDTFPSELAAAISVRNPRTGQQDYEIHPPGAETLDRIAADLRAGQTEWLAMGLEGRIAVLRRWAAEADSRKDPIIDALAADTGRYPESVSEFGSIKSGVERWASHAPAQLATPHDRETGNPLLKLDQALVPYPLLGVISPWNFPLLLSLIDAIPALVAGCAVLIKPSEVTPRFAAPLMDSIRAVPELAKVLAYVDGDGRTGQALIDRVDMVCFTGSVATGRKVGEQCARNFIPSFLELGGKDPSVILEGADIDRASSGLIWGSCANAGAACQSIERVYVHRSLYQPFLAKLLEKLSRVKLAYPTMQDGQIGPIIFAKQAAIIQDHIDDALAKGAKLETGEGVVEKDGGLYCFPAVLTGVDHSMKVMQEETFGPVLPIMPFDSEEEAIRLANDTVYGLSGSVWGASEADALRVAAGIDGGGLSINDTTLTAIMWEGEKQSFKLSGLGGSRMGVSSIRRFLRNKVYIKSQSPAGQPDPWWWEAVR